jgi:uncharacterized membrane protein
MAEQTQSLPIKSDDHTLQIELFIAQLLRWGVILSFVIVAVGVVALIVTDQTGYQQTRFGDLNSLITYHVDHPGFPNTIGDVWAGALEFRPFAIISLGLLVLIAIPVMRVAVSVIAFVFERDWLYVAITFFVFAMLMLSFALGEAGG